MLGVRGRFLWVSPSSFFRLTPKLSDNTGGIAGNVDGDGSAGAMTGADVMGDLAFSS